MYKYKEKINIDTQKTIPLILLCILMFQFEKLYRLHPQFLTIKLIR
jgi:hypothetical protein